MTRFLIDFIEKIGKLFLSEQIGQYNLSAKAARLAKKSLILQKIMNFTTKKHEFYDKKAKNHKFTSKKLKNTNFTIKTQNICLFTRKKHKNLFCVVKNAKNTNFCAKELQFWG